MLFVIPHGLIESILLMLTNLLMFGDGFCATDAFVQLLPIDRHLCQLGEMQHAGRYCLANKTLGSMAGEATVGGINPKSETEKMLLAFIVRE